VIQLHGGAEPAVQPLMAGDLATIVIEDDLAGADPRGDPEPSEADRQ